MTAELWISVPDDVADWLKQHADVSVAVTEAVRAQIRAVWINEVLRAAGVEPPRPGERLPRSAPSAAPATEYARAIASWPQPTSNGLSSYSSARARQRRPWCRAGSARPSTAYTRAHCHSPRAQCTGPAGEASDRHHATEARTLHRVESQDRPVPSPAWRWGSRTGWIGCGRHTGWRTSPARTGRRGTRR